ncbi:MAG: DUF1905 domain-containing protein [Bacteroidetes bacterium]|nr:DUF1905 domain-containing protein [Bacteroidota bacterium]
MRETSSIQFNSKIHKLEHLVGMHYLEVPKKVIEQLGGKLAIRLLCTVNDSLTFQCGLMALGNGKAYISINAKRMKQLGVKFGSKISVELKKDKSKYGMEMPKELAELLKQDAEGMKRFKLLTSGKQRYIIYYISMVKSTQIRIDRAILLIENLKRLPIGKESFREMLGKPAL